MVNWSLLASCSCRAGHTRMCSTASASLRSVISSPQNMQREMRGGSGLGAPQPLLLPPPLLLLLLLLLHLLLVLVLLLLLLLPLLLPVPPAAAVSNDLVL